MYDLAIIGGGWAGFNAAIEASKLGKKVCLIEKDLIGGTCLNRGCIPTKILIHLTKKHHQQLKFETLDFQTEKKDIVSKLQYGMTSTLKASGVDFIKGSALIVSNEKLIVTEEDKEVQAKFILIAAGSEPKDLPFLKFDHKHIVSSDDLLKLNSYPKRILIVGGGVIGCEFASALNKTEAEITVVEILDRLLPMFDVDISKKLEQSFKKKGITVKTSHNVKEEDLKAYDLVLLCLGRGFNSKKLCSSSIDIKLDKGGFVIVDDFLKTSQPNIYAAGDCTGGLQLAHVASFEAVRAVRNMFAKPEKINYNAVPASVFTDPEIAQIGTNEIEAKSKNLNIKIIKKPFSLVGMAHIYKQTDGFLKLIIDQDSQQILGASIVGPQATELINTLSVVVTYKLKLGDLKDLIFAHPSISEIFVEAIH